MKVEGNPKYCLRAGLSLVVQFFLVSGSYVLALSMKEEISLSKRDDALTLWHPDHQQRQHPEWPTSKETPRHVLLGSSTEWQNSLPKEKESSSWPL